MENSKCGKRSNEPGRVCSSCGGSGRANAHGDCMACGGTGRAVVVSMPIQQPAPPPAEQATEGVPPRIKCKRCRESIVSFQVCELANGDKPYCIDCERHLRLSPAEQAVVAESATTDDRVTHNDARAAIDRLHRAIGDGADPDGIASRVAELLRYLAQQERAESEHDRMAAELAELRAGLEKIRDAIPSGGRAATELEKAGKP